VILYLDTNQSQTNRIFNKIWEYKGAGSFFLTCFLCLPPPSRFRHHTNYIPKSGHHSSLTLTLTLFLIYSYLLPWHHHVIRSSFAFLQPCSSTGSLQNCFTKYLIPISAQYTCSLVWFIGASRLFGQLIYFFLRVLP
jgi:hypothetical protein